jgi:hypothetical protein
MAKADNVSLLEQHVEKLVLAVCVVLLAVAAQRWIFSSPVSMNNVPIEGVDEALWERALDVKGAYDTASVPVPPLPKWAGESLSLRTIAPQPHEDIDVAMPRLPMTVDIGRPDEGVIRLAQLTAVVPVPPRPVVVAGIELPDRPELADVAVAHGMLVYPSSPRLGRRCWRRSRSPSR